MEKWNSTTFEPLYEDTFEQVLTEGDLIEFIPRKSNLFRLQSSSLHDNNSSTKPKELDSKTQSHWAVYVGSGKIMHLAVTDTPYCVKVIREIFNKNEMTSVLNAVYPESAQGGEDNYKLMKSDIWMPRVRKDLLFDVARIQGADPYLNLKMDTEFCAGTSEEIVNVATFLEGKTLPHSFITKDCKDFAVFCRYGEIRSGLEKIEQRQQTTTKEILRMGVSGIVGLIAGMLVKVFLLRRESFRQRDII